MSKSPERTACPIQRARAERETTRSAWPVQVIKRGNVKVTICQAGADTRFVPERVEPFFSAMTPGSYISTGSAIERAYSERCV